MQNKRYKRLAWYPILSVGLSMVSFIMVKTGRDAVFFQKEGIYQLPLAYIWIAIASIPAAIIHLNVIKRWGAKKARIVVFFGSAVLLLLFAPFVQANRQIIMVLFFISVPTVFAALFAGAWLLAGDLIDGANQDVIRWIYSRIGAASMMGGIIGGLFAKGLSRFLEPRIIIFCGALILALVGVILLMAHAGFSTLVDTDRPKNKKRETDKKSITNPILETLFGPSDIFKQNYVLSLLGISGLAALASLFIDFQFYATTVITSHNNLNFYANFYIILNAASLLLQLFMAPLLQLRLGVGRALLLLPTILLSLSGVFSFWPLVQSRSILKITEGGIKSSIHRSMWEQVYLPIDQKMRGVVKAIVDGTSARLSEGIGAAVLYVWLLFTPSVLSFKHIQWIFWVIIGIILLWLILTHYLNRIGCSDIVPVEAQIRLPDG